MLSNEIWKDIPGYEGLYQISNKGRVKSLLKTVRLGRNTKIIPEKIIKTKNKDRYQGCSLSKNSVGKKLMVHRLVAESFVPNPENKPQVNHKDGNKDNNSADNLEWVTVSENAIHAFDNSLRTGVKGEKNNFSKLTIDQVFEIRKLLRSRTMLQREIAKIYNVTPSAISDIYSGKSWGDAYEQTHTKRKELGK